MGDVTQGHTSLVKKLWPNSPRGVSLAFAPRVSLAAREAKRQGHQVNMSTLHTRQELSLPLPCERDLDHMVGILKGSGDCEEAVRVP